MTRYTEAYKVDVPEGESGNWAVKKFTVSDKDAEFDSIQSMFSAGGAGRAVRAGNYTSISRNGRIIMSDTPAEIRDHIGFITRSYGNVLIAGLGIGMVLNAVALRESVQKITVVEQSPDVIKLVAGHYLAKPYGAKLEIVEGDIFSWKPAKGVKFDSAWFDIWDDLNTDNLQEMATLNRRFARIATDKGSWGRELLLDHRRRQSNSPWH